MAYDSTFLYVLLERYMKTERLESSLVTDRIEPEGALNSGIRLRLRSDGPFWVFLT